MLKSLLACVILIGSACPALAQDLKPPEKLPTSLAQPFPGHTPKMVTDFYKSCEGDALPVTIGNHLLLAPEIALDLIFDGLHAITGDDQNDTITEKVLVFDRRNSRGHLFQEFLIHFQDREGRFFAGMRGSYLVDMQIDDGNADINKERFMVEQRKVLWDVLKKTYFSKYNFKGEERIRDDAFYVTEWKGVDFIALPPFIGLYLYYRGLDKRMTCGDFQFRLQLQPGQRFLSGADVPGGMMLEVRPKGFPIGVVASMGWYEKRPEFEFIGIGTSLDAVKSAIVQQRDNAEQHR